MLRKQFEIDNYLGRWTKALGHLHGLGAHEELREYVVKHVLYKDAIDIYKYQPEQLRDISLLYANYLQEASKYKDAGIGIVSPRASHFYYNANKHTAYESLSLYTDAYKCYQLAHLWRESLYTAMLVPLPPAELTAHATTLATTLAEENKDYTSASQIHAEHLNDIPTAARLLCRASRFSDASRLLTLHGVQALIPDIIDTTLADAMGSMTDLLADFRSQLQAQVPRIIELRTRRMQDPLAYFGGDPATADGAGGVDIPDNVSLAATDASTMTSKSMFTRYTGKTGSVKTTTSRQSSRNRRREERKRARGKKGTVYEEEYLVNSVRRLIERVSATVAEVENLVDSLLRRGMRERAAAIERAMSDVLRMCSESQEEVFALPAAHAAAAVEDEEDENVAEATANGAVDAPMPKGGQRVFWESIVSTMGVGKGQEAPKVQKMKKSALLN